MSDHFNHELKKQIKEELNDLVQQYPNIFNDESIDLLFKTLYLPVDSCLHLDGLQTRVPAAVRKIFLDSTSKEERLIAFADFAKVEPFLRKITYLKDESVHESFANQRSGLAKYINFLGLNPTNLQLATTSEIDIISLPHFQSHIVNSYKLRNIESHLCENWSNKQFYEHLRSILVTYLYTIHLHFELLNSKIFPEPDLTQYLENVVYEFENWQNRFVHINGHERFEEVPILAIETDEWTNQNLSLLREGSINDLRKNLEENTMVVLGDPGMGKSTTMQYIAYNDAKEILLNQSISLSRIPLYLELKLLSKSETILLAAARKLGISQDQLMEYFKNGRVTMMLDGLNEVYSDIRRSIRTEIQELIREFSELFIIVTSRPLAYSNEFKGTPVFVLQRMEDSQIVEFLAKNCNHQPTENIILSEVATNPRLGKIVRVPLLLKMLISVVKNNRGLMPANKTLIIKEFIKNIYERERQKDITDIDFRTIHRLLSFLGHKTREMNGSNVGWTLEEFDSIIEKRIERSKFMIDVYQFIDMAVDLNLLVKDDTKYSFIHELYQEYFAAEEIYRIMTVEND